MSILFYYQSYLIILGKSDRNDTLRQYLTNVNKPARAEGESRPLRLQERLMNLKCKQTREGRERILALTLAVKTDVFAYFKR